MRLLLIIGLVAAAGLYIIPFNTKRPAKVESTFRVVRQLPCDASPEPNCLPSQ